MARGREPATAVSIISSGSTHASPIGTSPRFPTYETRGGHGSSKNKLGAGIDVKSTGGYVVVAPSQIGPSKSGPGGSYRWEVSPFDVDIPRLPIWLMTMLAPPAPPPRYRHHERRYGSSNVDGLAKWVAQGAEGERNNRIHWAACRVGEMARAQGGSSSRRPISRERCRPDWP